MWVLLQKDHVACPLFSEGKYTQLNTPAHEELLLLHQSLDGAPLALLGVSSNFHLCNAAMAHINVGAEQRGLGVPIRLLAEQVVEQAAAMEKRGSSGVASLVLLGLLLAAALWWCQCHGARDVPAEPEKEKPLRPQNVFGFGGFYPGPSVNWVFPGPNGVTPQVGFGGMPGSSAFPGIGGSGGVSPFTPGGGGVVGVHGGAAGADAAAKKP